MKLEFIGHSFKYEIENICRLFFPFEKITENGEGKRVITSVEQLDDKALLEVDFDGVKKSLELSRDTEQFDKECERNLAVMLYEILCGVTKIRPQWGILTGVRPGKLMRSKVETYGLDGAKDYFRDKLKCSDAKIDLCLRTVENENRIIERSQDNWFSLYLSVPFCPTRCSYCSFVSHSVEKSMALVDDYVKLLCEELKHTAQIADRLNLKLATVYLGGGTPTTLSAKQLETVLNTVNSNYDTKGALEFNVEAGRPDTIDEEKLTVIKNSGATRISINPQTLNDDVLKNIGRRHSARQAIGAFNLARKCGFDNINTDLIAGLPGDTVDSFSKTVEGILILDPESITVHSLSMKKSSDMTVNACNHDAKRAEDAAQMLNILDAAVKENYIPYYLYRQSKTVGNLENIGYSKRGKEGLYNIYIMDETHTILACGASATTKLKGKGGEISRIYNYKYPYEYISRFDSLIERKKEIEQFYNNYCK